MNSSNPALVMSPVINTLIDAFQHAADSTSGITFIKSQQEEVYLSYHDLYKSALCILNSLQETGIMAGDSLILQIERNDYFLQTFWACMLGGIIPVPLTIGQQSDHKTKLINIWLKLNMPFIMVDESGFENLRKSQEQQESDPRWTLNQRFLSIEETLLSSKPGVLSKIASNDIAYIQFSSGSTGEPKGVVLTHQNLVANTQDIARRSEITIQDRALSWMPLTHDMGLICFHLTSVLSKIDQYIIPVSVFIRRPLLWLDKANEFSASLLYSPNFGYQYLLNAYHRTENEFSWDLSQVRLIYNGAEPISYEICDRFYEIVSKYGCRRESMFPGYGLAEASVAVTLPRVGEKLKVFTLDRNHVNVGNVISHTAISPVCFVAVGSPIDHCEVRICGDDNRQLAENTIGHIQIRGENVTTCYYNDEESTKKSLTDDGWLRTGDLGFFNNGSLVITGRKKNLIIINGQNYYPQDLERCAQELPEINMGEVAAAAIPSLDNQDLFLFVLFKKTAREFAPLAVKVKEKIADRFGLLVKHVIPVSKIPKTTSGKVQYFKLVEQYENGLFEDKILAGERYIQEYYRFNVSQMDLQHQLASIISETLGYDNPYPDFDFFKAGMNSLQANQLAVRVLRLGFEINIREIYEYSSIRRLSEHLLHKERKVYNLFTNAPDTADDYPLTFGQLRFWTISQFSDKAKALNIFIACSIRGLLDLVSLERALDTVISRHESLRTIFILTEDGEPRQKILGIHEHGFRLGYEDLRGAEDPRVQAMHLAAVEASSPFELSRGPLLRVRLLQVSEAEYYFLFTIHHIISDGWSMQVLGKELRQLYSAALNGKADPLPPLRIQYKDYAYWQQGQLGGEVFRAHQLYWQEQFSGDLPVLDLPIIGVRPAIQGLKGNSLWFSFSGSTTASLEELSRKHNTTLFTVMVSLLNTLFYKYTGAQDILIGTDAAGRSHVELEDQIGYYLNLLVLRSRFKPSDSFIALLDQVNDTVLKAYEHQLYSFELILEQLQLKRDPSRYPLVDVLVLFQNFSDVLSFGELFEGTEINVHQLDNGTSLTDLLFEFRQTDDCLDCRINYNTDLFTEKQILDLMNHLQELTRSIVAQPEASLASYDWISSSERKILEGFSAGPVIKGQEQETLVSLFESAASRYPESVALISEGGKELSYRELNESANRVADYLRSKYSVQGDHLVGVMTGRNSWLLISLLGILKSGGAYVPIDPDYPRERIVYMLGDAGVNVVLTDRPGIAGEGIPELCLPDSWEQVASYSSENVPVVCHENDLAYVIYTSGSSGKPKGVMIEHRSVVNYVLNFQVYFNLSAKDIMLQQASIAFDTAVEEIFPVLCIGGRLVMADEGGKNIEKLEQLIEQQRVSLVSTTPLVIEALNQRNSSLSNIRGLISGGDELKASYVNKIIGRFPVYNTYGPTEATVCATYQQIGSLADVSSIGKPISNVQVYVLDEGMNLQGIGVPGEICIGGSGVARGYLNQLALSQEKFVPNRYGAGRLYRTGDMGRWGSDGNLEYLGRRDEQVKLRGYRIELGEIESVLERYPGVSQAVVTSREAGPHKYLVAYLSGSVSAEDPEAFRSYLRDYLPEYMIPSYFMQVESFPVTGNGKIDKRKLPLPETGAGHNYQAPETALERQLAMMWSEVLVKEDIGLGNNFFELGGHSLKAIQLISRIHRDLNVKLELVTLFTHPTLAGQAGLIRVSLQQAYEQIPVIAEQADYELSHSQKRLWVLDQLQPGMIAYNIPLAYEFRGLLDLVSLERALDTVISRHESLRTIFILTEDGEPRQKILGIHEHGFRLGYEDLRGAEAPRVQAMHLAAVEASSPFELSRGPLDRKSVV